MVHVAEFLVVGVEKFLRGLVGEDEKLALQNVAKDLGGGFVVAVGSHRWFGHYPVSDSRNWGTGRWEETQRNASVPKVFLAL